MSAAFFQSGSPRRGWTDGIGILAVLTLLGALWIVPVLPLQDYGDWVLQGRILAGIVADDGAAAYYDLRFWPVPPNLLAPAILALLSGLAAPDVAGRLFLSGYILLLAAAVYRWLGPAHPARWAGPLVAVGLFFYMGFLSWLLGLAFLVMALPDLERAPDRSTAWRLGIWALVIYLTHGFFVGVLLLGWLVRVARREGRSLPWGELAALLPMLVLLTGYVTGGGSEGGIRFYDSLRHGLNSFRYGLMPFPRIALVDVPLPITLFNLAWWAGLAALLWVGRADLRLRSYRGMLLLAVVALLLFNPVYAVGRFFPVSPRLVPVAVLLVMACLSSGARRPRLAMATTGLTLLAAGLQAGLLVTAGGRLQPDMAALKRQYDAAPSTLVIGKVYPRDFAKSPGAALGGVVNPFLHGYKVGVAAGNVGPVPIQTTSVLHPGGGDTLRARMRFDSLFTATPTLQAALEAGTWQRHRMAEVAGQIIVVGTPATRAGWVAALSGRWLLTAQGERWSALRRIGFDGKRPRREAGR